MNDMEECSSSTTEPSTVEDLKGNNKDSIVISTSTNNKEFDGCDPGTINQCSSAKQSRKMNEHSHERSLSYTWKQTEFGVDILVKLKSAENLKKLDVIFTSKTAKISLSDEEKHVIHFHENILKEKSRVEIKKGNYASLHIVKKVQGLWPCLEINGAKGENINEEVFDTKKGKETESEKEIPSSPTQNGSDPVVEHGTSIANKNEVDTCLTNQLEANETDKKPVFHLDHLKHDFFERETLLTLQVYTKCPNKDAVGINFNKQGFVLRFQTSDVRFLQIHEGTSADTKFSWTVTTRGEIKPDECVYKVKPSVIEISLHKVSSDRWVSLEAPIRKNNETSQSDAWLPLNASQGKITPATSSSSSSSSSLSSLPAPTSASSAIHDELSIDKRANKKVIFDEDLTDVCLRDKGSKMPNFYKENQTNTDSTLPTFSENLKLRSNTFQDYNKPTAKVQPLTKRNEDTETVVSPGFAGLVNLGNTCFMNCVLQVVANTREFRDYFLDGRFHYEINEDNPLGMKGHLAATFGALLRWLWSCKRHCWEPRKLKDLISKKNPQFFGFAQHDAHEFLAFLLDGLHEDLNRIKKKPYIETVDSGGRPDEVVAAEAWGQYKKRNDSVVVDLFQGQYKSKLVCPKCGKVSITFDPFLYLSVPLPKKKKVIPVIFMWKEYYKKPHLFQVQVAQDSSVEQLKDILSQRTLVSTADIRVFEAYKGKIHKFFLAGSSLSQVEAKDIIIACEVLSKELAGEEVLEIPVMQRTQFPTELPACCAFCHKLCMEGSTLKRCTKCYKVGYCDRSCQRSHWNIHKSLCSICPEPIGCPFIISVPRSRAVYSHLVKLIEGFARFSVNIFQPPVKQAEVGANPSTSSSNLSSSLSQSCSSLNSLDSLSSASSTCTLTGEQSDPQIQDDAQEGAASSGIYDSDSLNAIGPSPMPSCESLSSVDGGDNVSKVTSQDSGIESVSIKSEKQIPTSSVMGVQSNEAERDKATTTFFIRPITMEGVDIKGTEQLEDKGDVPLELTSHKFLSMDWKNDERQPSRVLVQSKELEAKEIDDVNNVNNESNKPTLYQCLELFTEPEVLRPEEAWYCPNCKQHVEASKQMAIWRLPHTLIIQLKRFSFQNFLMRSKIKKHVDFPTRGLDLRQFCAGTNSSPSPPPIYDLYGVANHHGLLIGGHYTSFVRCAADGMNGTDEIGWRLCDDSRVSPVANEKSVVTSDAYLLFYRRRGMPAAIGSSARLSTVPITSSGVIPMELKAYDYTEEDSSYDNNPGGIEEFEVNEAVSLTSSSVVTDTPSSNDASGIELSKRQQGDEGTKLTNATTTTVPEDVGPPCDSTNRNGEEEEEKEEEEGDDNVGEESLREKGDREKEFYDCDKNEDYFYSDEEDSDEDRERNLVIDTSPDLGYTDMEAVD